MDPKNSCTDGVNERSAKIKTYLLYATICSIIIFLIGGSVYYYTSIQAEKNEALAYEVLDGNNNPKDYIYFLEKYPDSSHSVDVKNRLEKLEKMLRSWDLISLSDRAEDFIRFKGIYSDPLYTHLCDIKIDSLDFIEAQKSGTQEAFQYYLEMHPDGRYSSEASIAKGSLNDLTINDEVHEQITQVICNFFRGFETQDETSITSNIVGEMKNFLGHPNQTKADVIQTIKTMFNEHILGCQFVINRDLNIVKSKNSSPDAIYTASFTLDQHIQRDNEGKTFGTYKCMVDLTSDLLISSISMQEYSTPIKED